ncbi:calcium/sodium antiporter [Ornithinibacillus halophilus]|uniref:Cation:H+ antiporter n=1 Tax=Ornithinibacillus halophilus TaxID=930117 RepID=A0A1M5DX79_9BACI|nr:calcium/sodium antiporter [Ornithinibacillus halophilus]SHF71545.1 cation:H+ antiporter [Ornithinibacillus halophilus]
MAYILLVVGFVLLIKGADFFVEGSSNIARLLRVPSILIGLTIVAFGTSSPEATVSIIAALEGSSDVSLGNVVGSNIFNLTLVVGIAAIIFPLKVETETIVKEIPFTLLASGALLILISDVFLQGEERNLLTRSDGLIFLLFLSVFLYYVFEVALKNRNKTKNEPIPVNVKWPKNIVVTVLGLVGIVIGGEMVVSNGTEIAYSLGMSETLVGLTIIAVGTSLPELVTSITAALKKESEIALGNIVGSNIFNILFVLGSASVISPLVVNTKVFTDIFVMIILTVLLMIFSRTKFRVGKIEGSVLVILYILYMIFIILRN